MSRMPHTSCHRGKLVRVKLHDGTVFFDHFRERNDREVIFDNHRVAKADIASFSIAKRGTQRTLI